MSAIAHDPWHEQEDDPDVRIDGSIDPQVEDAYWQSVHWSQPSHRSDCSYEEDYAPAYCVGYIGYAQYGGRFADAEASLCANWIRIKGASKLSLAEAMQAIRAAWDHAEHGQLTVDEEDEELVRAAMAGQRASAQRSPAYAAA